MKVLKGKKYIPYLLAGILIATGGILYTSKGTAQANPKPVVYYIEHYHTVPDNSQDEYVAALKQENAALQAEYTGLQAAYNQLASQKQLVAKAPSNLRYFKNYIELQQYVDQYRDGKKLLPPMSPVTVDGKTMNPDCDDYAKRFILAGLSDGYIFGDGLVWASKIYGTQVLPGDQYHDGVITRAGNAFYYVETSDLSTQYQITRLSPID